MKNILKKGLILLFLIEMHNVFSAAITVKSEIPVKNTVFVTYGGGKSGIFYLDFRIDALLDGFKRIQFKTVNDQGKLETREALLDIPGSHGWHEVKILKDKRIYIGAGSGIFDGGPLGYRDSYVVDNNYF